MTITEYLKTHPDMSADEQIAGLAKLGIHPARGSVRAIRSKLGLNKRGPGRPKGGVIQGKVMEFVEAWRVVHHTPETPCADTTAEALGLTHKQAYDALRALRRKGLI